MTTVAVPAELVAAVDVADIEHFVATDLAVGASCTGACTEVGLADSPKKEGKAQ